MSRRRSTGFAEVLGLALAGLALFGLAACDSGPREAPESAMLLRAQASLPFQVLIPAYLPPDLDRASAQLSIDRNGPTARPLVQIIYRGSGSRTLIAREWLPGEPAREVLAGSRPVQTRWGTGWLLATKTGPTVVWVDVGAVRVGLYGNVESLTAEQLIQIAESLGPAAGRIVTSQPPARVVIKAASPPPAAEARLNPAGIQEIDLIITPSGYSPPRFSIRKGVPTELIFRALGQVGCGNELVFPADPSQPTTLILGSAGETKRLSFTPTEAGEFEFRCTHGTYWGVMTVRE